MRGRTRERPIGYWLKHLDRLLETAFDDALADEGVSRRHWQAMNVVKEAPVDDDDLAQSLGSFWDERSTGSADVTDDLVRGGWVRKGPDGRYVLTPSGESAYGRIARKVQGIRTRWLTA